MKKIGFGIFLLFIAANLFSQTLKLKEKKNKWGYVNNQKEWVIKPVFEEAERFINSAALVKQDGKYRLINEKGEFLMESEYDTLYRSGSFVVYRFGSKYGILDSLGVQLSKPVFDKVDGCYENRFTVKMEGNWITWTLDGELKAIENLVFINPDDYPIFGANCLNLKDRKEIIECSNTALLINIYKNIKYPSDARYSGIQGTVVVQFFINADGSISDINLLKDIGGGCGEEAMRVVKLLKVYEAPKMEGSPVTMRYILPVKYRLE